MTDMTWLDRSISVHNQDADDTLMKCLPTAMQALKDEGWEIEEGKAHEQKINNSSDNSTGGKSVTGGNGLCIRTTECNE